MVAGVNPSSTVFNTSSPFIVASDETQATQKTEPTILTPPQDSSALADTANAFFPPASIAQLTSDTASVVLTEQAREKPIILQDPNPPLDTSSLGSLNLFDELLSERLDAPPEAEGQSTTSFLSLQEDNKDDSASDTATPTSEFTTASVAYETAQLSAPKQDYATSTLDIAA